MNRIGPSLVLILALAMSGCWFRHKKPKTSSVPPPPAPLSTQTPKTKPIEPPSVTLPAKPVGSLPDMPQLQPATTQAETPPPKPAAKRAVRKPAAKAPTDPAAATVPSSATSSAPPPAAAPAAATPPVPQLGVLLTPEQHNQYEAEYARDMASAMDGLIHVLETSLSPAQKESMTRVRSFMRQAEEAHGRDLATAAQLARRAAVLAQDVVQSQH